MMENLNNYIEGAPVKVHIDNVVKKFNGRNGEMVALNGVTLDIHDNEFICVVGPSGCGKSTLLNIIAGLLESTSGQVYCDGELVTGTGHGARRRLPAVRPLPLADGEEERPLRPGDEGHQGQGGHTRSRVMQYLRKVDLEKFANHYPKELSGGMKQRVAIARAYAADPKVLLMDEPFGALDAQTRTQLQSELLETWEKDRKTCFFITHDVDEAIILAQKVIVMSAAPAA